MEDKDGDKKHYLYSRFDAETWRMLVLVRKALGAASYAEVLRRAVRDLAERMQALGQMENT